MRLFLYLTTIIVLFTACATSKPKYSFQKSTVPTAPDYAQTDAWAALPSKIDLADSTSAALKDDFYTDDVDVFFVHPTTYIGLKGQTNWNGSTQETTLNERTDESSILYQASIFNFAPVYAPRYRQAHLYAYSSEDTLSAKRAFNLAYSDVKAAFEYYLKHYNQGKPMIIASHSQGTTHCRRLLKEYFDGKPLEKQLVAAYLVGIPVLKDQYESIPLCETPEQTTCFCTWRTFKYGYTPKKYTAPSIAVTNPITWTTDAALAPTSIQKGSILTNFDKPFYQITDAKIIEELGILWTHKPKFPGSIFFIRKNYHVGDYNLFYLDIRKNAQLRIQSYLKNQ